MLNKVMLMGRLTKDPELRTTAAGTSQVRYTIACDRDFKNKTTGERETDFFDVTSFGATADFTAQNFFKGRMIILCGRINLRSWVDKNGNNQRGVDIIAENVYFGDTRREYEGRDTPRPNTQPSDDGAQFGTVKTTRGVDIGFDELPDDGMLPF